MAAGPIHHGFQPLPRDDEPILGDRNNPGRGVGGVGLGRGRGGGGGRRGGGFTRGGGFGRLDCGIRRRRGRGGTGSLTRCGSLSLLGLSQQPLGAGDQLVRPRQLRFQFRKPFHQLPVGLIRSQQISLQSVRPLLQVGKPGRAQGQPGAGA